MFEAYKNLSRPVFAALAFLAVGAVSSGAQAGEAQGAPHVCGAQAEIGDALAKSFGEEELFGGVIREGLLTLIYGNVSTGTWTIVQARNPREACAVAAGGELKISDDARKVNAVTDLGGLMAIAIDDDESWTLTITHRQGIMSFTSVMTGEGWRYSRRRLPEA